MPHKDPEKRKAYQLEWKKKNPNKYKERRAKWKSSNPEKARNYQRKWRVENLGKAREIRWRMQGINFTIQQYDAMLESQNGLCAICLRPQEEFKIRFAVDHDHQTNRVRGLLCFNCNNGLSKFGDSIEVLVRAVDYIKQSL